MASNTANPAVSVNGVSYQWPAKPLVVVCIDGGDPAYFDHGLTHGYIPNVARFMKNGFNAVADGTVPSVTCTNNMSIVTGTPASRHGISGNFYLDTATGEAVVMTGPELLRADTLFAHFARAGARVCAVTAKDKLRQQLGKGLDIARGNICFSSERADRCTIAEHGIDDVLKFTGMPLPNMYSMDLSLFVLEAGVRILERDRPNIMYLSLTDYVQHKYAPDEPDAVTFYKKLDEYFGRLEALGATVALTADHGMNDKSRADGTPNVIWLQDILDAEFGKGDSTVICPITDAFVAHHGALGGFVRVYCRGGNAKPQQVMKLVEPIAGIQTVLDRQSVCKQFDLPPDREGDVAVISGANYCVGGSAKAHDLSGLAGHRLRTHGGISEARVPFVISAPVTDAYRAKAASQPLNSYQLFEFALNGVVH